MSVGTVGIRRLKVHTIVGLLPHERIQKQDIFVSVELSIDFSAVCTMERKISNIL